MASILLTLIRYYSEGEWEGSVWERGGVNVDEERKRKQNQCGRDRNQAVSSLTHCKCTLLVWCPLCTELDLGMGPCHP